MRLNPFTRLFDLSGRGRPTMRLRAFVVPGAEAGLYEMLAFLSVRGRGRPI